MNDQVRQAIEVLKNGGIIIYPTDTAFGIGCRIDNEQAVQRLFTIRQRPLSKVPPVLFSSLEMVREYTTSIPQEIEPLIAKYWPGALTVILPAKKDKISQLVIGQTGIGCRIPNHLIPLTIIKEVGVPIVGTSANFTGEPTPYRFSDLNPKLIKSVDFVVSGETTVQKESTVIDCTQNPWKVIREGAVKLDINK